jgi:hypothetical protein
MPSFLLVRLLCLHQVTNRLESGVGSASIVSAGAVNVVSRVWGWRKHWLGGSQVADMGALSLPPLEYNTRAVWIDVPPEVQLYSTWRIRSDPTTSVMPRIRMYFLKNTTKMEGPLHARTLKVQSDLDLELDLSDDQCAGAVGIDLTAAKSKGAGALGGEGAAPRCSSEAPKSADAAWFSEESEAGGAEAEVSSSSSSSSSSSRFLKSLHGLNHVLCAIAPLFVLCDPGDIGAWKAIKAYWWTLATLFNSLFSLSLYQWLHISAIVQERSTYTCFSTARVRPEPSSLVRGDWRPFRCVSLPPVGPELLCPLLFLHFPRQAARRHRRGGSALQGSCRPSRLRSW